MYYSAPICAFSVSAVAEHSSPASIHDFRIVKGVTHTNILFDVSIGNDFPIGNEELLSEIKTEIKKISPLYNLILTVDRDYFSERYEG